MRTYTAISGQSIYDVCLQTYGTLDYLYKLMQDNGIEGLDADISSGQSFVWDDNLVVDQQINAAFAASGINYATNVDAQGSVFFVNTIGGGQVIQPNPTPVPGTGGGGGGTGQYSVTYGTSYTSNQDGLTQFSPLDINNNPLIGCDIVQIEKEIKPLKPSDYSWNKTSGILTLLNGVTLDTDETAFILYSKITQ